MTRKTLAVFLTVCASSVFGLSAAAQMTDDAVVNYVKAGMAAGKSQQEMISELARRGVTREQAERLKERFEQEQGQAEAVQTAGAQERTRRSVDAQNEIVAGDMDMVVTEAVDPTDATATEAADVVYGRNIFSTRNLTFAPSENLATPENYTLGPGDEVIIDIWGTNQTTIRQTISPDGFININDIGLVYLSGMTVKEADSYMRRKLNQIYSVDGDDAKSEMKLSLGSIRTIQVNIMGEVVMPGTYYLSSMSNLYHAVYRAGGVNALGSLRDIQLVRDGKKVASVDVYDFLQNGTLPADITLQEGDIILVHPYDALVDISGNVKRPMFYELKEGETIGDLISYAGGFTGDAYSSNLRVIRRNGREYQIFTVDQPEYSSFNLMDGDAVSVGAMLDRYENKLEIRGAVYRPGIYQLCDNISTVSQLIAKADGLTGDAFTNRAILHREKEDLTLEVIPLDIKSILDGAAPDVTLQKNDALYIPSIHDLNDIGYITVSGEVARPGDFVFADNTTLEDIIIQAGGLLESASTVKVDVSRRMKDPYSTEPTDTISRIYSFSIKPTFIIGEQEPAASAFPIPNLQFCTFLSLSLLLGLDAQCGMRHCAETLGRNQFSGFTADAVSLVLDAYQRGPQVLNKLQLTGGQASGFLFRQRIRPFFQDLVSGGSVVCIIAVRIHNTTLQFLIVALSELKFFHDNGTELFKFSVRIPCFFSHSVLSFEVNNSILPDLPEGWVHITFLLRSQTVCRRPYPTQRPLPLHRPTQAKLPRPGYKYTYYIR